MKPIHILLICLVIFIPKWTTAQTHTIKSSFTDALLGNFNINYERAINPNHSLLLKVGFMTPTKSPFINEKTISPSGYTLIRENSGFSATMEYRRYVLTKKIPEGFYFAPYLRFYNQSLDYQDGIKTWQFNVESQITTLGVGGQIGYQWIFHNMFSLDFYFFGMGIDYHMARAKYVIDKETEGFQYNEVTRHIDEVFETYDYLKKRLNHKITDNYHSSKLLSLFPGFRMGISFGVTF